MAASTVASTSRWTLDYATPPANRVKVVAPPAYASPHTLTNKQGANQLSRSSSAAAATPTTAAAAAKSRPAIDLDELRQQKAWELATSPAKAVPMQAFMMYMSGSGIQIFSIMSVWFLLKQAVAGAMGVQQAFAGFDAAIKPKLVASPSPHHQSRSSEPQSFLQQKIVYVVCQLGLLAVALWKIRSMGLLPDSAEDWAPIFGNTSWLVRQHHPQHPQQPVAVTDPLVPVPGAPQSPT
ncbi:hypothetical protein JCM3774_005006 [Rhodotorula dairenensis]